MHWDELALEGVSVAFNAGRPGEYRALADVNLAVRRGEFYCLLGPSGCGKSTVLSLLAGFISPTSGAIRMGDRRILEAGTDRVVVFQDAANAEATKIWAEAVQGDVRQSLPVVRMITYELTFDQAFVDDMNELAKFMVQKGALKQPIDWAKDMNTNFLREVDPKLVATGR